MGEYTRRNTYVLRVLRAISIKEKQKETRETMAALETTSYSKWYASHRRFSFTARFCIDLYEDGKQIPDTIFKPFLKSLSCHSKSEEKMFQRLNLPDSVFDEHTKIIPSKTYTNEEKYNLCINLLPHMKQEESLLEEYLFGK